MILLCNQDGLRIDAFLAGEVDGLSRSAAQQLLEKGQVSVNGAPVKKNYKTRAGDEISFELPQPEPVELMPENIPLDIRYEDNDVVVINKPKGLVVHPAPGHWSGTLVNALMHHLNKQGIPAEEQNRAGLVHRIDKNTSGLLVIAKDEQTHARLAKQFFDHTIQRRYVALVWGNFDEDEAVSIDAMLAGDGVAPGQAVPGVEANSERPIPKKKV